MPRRYTFGNVSEFVVITGLSGAGRSLAADDLEDLGWFVIDNLPPELVPKVAELAVFAEWMLTTPIVVFSHGEPALGMSNARLATLPLVEEVAKLKDQPGGDLVVFGGATIVQELVRLGLVDEYWLKVEPVAIGQGLPVFGRVDSPVDLTLVWHKVYRSGVVGLRYEAARSSDEIVRSRWTQEERV